MAETISRRNLLHLSYGAAAALGVSDMASEFALASTSAEGASLPSDRLEEYGGPSVSINSGSQLHYREDWLGAPWLKPEHVVLIHGNLETGTAWFGWVPRMAQEFRVLRPDLPGFGHST